MRYRTASLNDLEDLAKLFQELTKYNAEGSGLREEWGGDNWLERRSVQAKSALDDQNGVVFIAENSSDEVVGYAYVYKCSPYGYVVFEELYVTKGYRRQKVGESLLRMVEKYAHKEKLTVKIEVYPWNELAKRFYESQGFWFESLTYLK